MTGFINLGVAALLVIGLVFIIRRMMHNGRRRMGEYRVQRLRGWNAASTDNLRELVASFPRSEPTLAAWCAAGVLEHGLGSAEAERRVQGLRKAFPRNEYACKLQASIYSTRGDFKDAERLLRTALRGASRTSARFWLHAEYGALAERQGLWLEALERWHEAQEKFPDRAEPLLARARVSQRLGLPAEGETYLLRASRLAPTSEDVLRACGIFFEAKCDWQQAAAYWARFTASFDTKPEGYIRHIKALAELGDTAAASALARRVSFLFPRDQSITDVLSTLCQADKHNPSAMNDKPSPSARRPPETLPSR